jgi:fermentation-respiration switch protein FrsA (DUF1100 family)
VTSPKKRRALRALSFAVFALVILAVAAVYWLGGLLAAPWPQPVGTPPVGCSDVSFPSASGSTIRGWFCPVTPRRGSVLLLPGVRANRLSMVERGRFLRRAGYSVLLIDFQATGESPGEHITFGWLESRDARAAVDFLRTAHAGEPIAVIGSSLGGAAAVLADPPLAIDALILEALYPTIERATGNRLAIRFGPAGRLAAPLLLLQLPFRLGVGPDALRPVDRIGSLQVPLFVISGSEDRHTTREDTLFLYRHASPPKSLWLVPGAAHVDLHRFAGAEYEQRVLAFLDGADDTHP